MSVADVENALQDEVAFLEMLQVVARGFRAKTPIGARIVAGWLGTFEKLAEENQSFFQQDAAAVRKALKAEKKQLLALVDAIIKGHPDADSWMAFLQEDIAFADELQDLTYDKPLRRRAA